MKKYLLFVLIACSVWLSGCVVYHHHPRGYVGNHHWYWVPGHHKHHNHWFRGYRGRR